MRLSEPAAPELVQTAYVREIADTAILYAGMSSADLAHVVHLIEIGVAPRDSGGLLLHALLAIHPQPPLDFSRDPAAGDVYSNREAYLSMHTSHAGWLGAGRARREASTVAYRVAVRARLLQLAVALIECARAIVDLAGDHHTTIFPDYTYLQTAQPTTFGHYVLTFAYPILRDLERLRAVYSRTNVSPAGSGSVNGSRLPLDRKRLAKMLGFDSAISHTRDAMWQADGPIETAALLSAALTNLDRLAEDLQIFSTQEFGLVELADRHARTSKIMPQKKNPYSLTYVRGVTGEMLGVLAGMAAIGKTPSGQPDNRIFAQSAVPRALDQAIGALQLMAGVLRGLQINTERAAERARASFAGATDLAEVLMLDEGLDYRTAHNIVSRLVRDALESGQGTTDITSDQVAVAAEAVIERRIEIEASRLAAVMDPASIVAARSGFGGAAQAPLGDMLAEIRSALTDHQEWRQASELHIQHADTALQVRAASLSVAPSAPSPPISEESTARTMADLLDEDFSPSKKSQEKTMRDLLDELPEPSQSWHDRE